MRACFVFILSFYFATASAQTAPPSLEWQRCMGGSAEDQAYDLQPTSDGGFIAVGASKSSYGDVSQNKGFTDGWIIKFDAAGTIQWQKNYGGIYYDDLVKIKEAPSGGYIATGYTSSSDGDFSGLHGGTDIWLLRIDNSGNLLWQKTLGGTLNEFAGSVFPTTTGGFVLCGNTTSNDGDVHGLHPGLGNLGDSWVVNLDASGTIIWENCYGGSGGESAGNIEQTTDGGFIFSCYTSSNDGDVTGNLNGDYWLVKLNSNGGIIWQKCFGGTAGETPFTLAKVSDGYIMAGVSFSNDAQNQNHGNGDVWIVKVDLTGKLQWEKFYGGSETDIAKGLIVSSDGGFFVTGTSRSFNGNLCKNYGTEDYWIFKISSAGNIQWQKSYGGSSSDHPQGIIKTADGSLFIDGYTTSDDNDVSGNHGNADAWLIKLSFGIAPLTSVTISSSSNNICFGKKITFTAAPVNAGSNPLYHWYINKAEQPAATTNIFSSAALLDGDIVTCSVQANAVCTDVSAAASNEIKIIIDKTGAPFDFLPLNLQICEGVAQEINSLQSFSSYLWNTGSVYSSITIYKSGNYWLEVPYNNGCKTREYINVLPKKCTQSLYLPTAFTPNNDGKNDIFKPTVYGVLENYKLTIYNRWGQIIATSYDPSIGWDGKWNGRMMESSTFIWMCTYQLAGEAKKIDKGTITIIR